MSSLLRVRRAFEPGYAPIGGVAEATRVSKLRLLLRSLRSDKPNKQGSSAGARSELHACGCALCTCNKSVSRCAPMMKTTCCVSGFLDGSALRQQASKCSRPDEAMGCVQAGSPSRDSLASLPGLRLARLLLHQCFRCAGLKAVHLVVQRDILASGVAGHSALATALWYNCYAPAARVMGLHLRKATSKVLCGVRGRKRSGSAAWRARVTEGHRSLFSCLLLCASPDPKDGRPRCCAEFGRASLWLCSWRQAAATS